MWMFWLNSGRHHLGCLWNPLSPQKHLTLNCSKWWKIGLVGTAHLLTVWYWGNSSVYTLVFILPKTQAPRKKLKKKLNVCWKRARWDLSFGDIHYFIDFVVVWVIHSLNNFPLLVRVSVSMPSITMERYKPEDIPMMKRAIKKWTTSHESSRQACFHHIHFFS